MLDDKMLKTCDDAIYTMGKIMAMPEKHYFVKYYGVYYVMNQFDEIISEGNTILECIEIAEKKNYFLEVEK